MKKFMLVVVFVSASQVSFAATDFTAKRKAIITKEAAIATELYMVRNALLALKEERTALGADGNFLASDFDGSNVHIDSYTAGAFLDFTATAIEATFQDAGNGNLNKNLILRMRK